MLNNIKNKIINANAKIKDYLHNVYLLYLRYRIKNINNSQDIINIFKSINYYHKNITCDQITNIITECINLYPLDYKEIQLSSLLQQKHDKEFGMENYVTFVFWTCILQSIMENEKMTIIDKDKFTKSLKVVTKQELYISRNV